MGMNISKKPVASTFRVDADILYWFLSTKLHGTTSQKTNPEAEIALFHKFLLVTTSSTALLTQPTFKWILLVLVSDLIKFVLSIFNVNLLVLNYLFILSETSLKTIWRLAMPG
jgi:hypothetical protein